MLNRKRVFYGDGSKATNSEIMSDNAGNKHRKMAATSVNGICPVQLDVEVVEIAESDEEKDLVGGGGATGRSKLPLSFSGGQQNLHASLKTEIAKLCKALKLSEDVVHFIQKLLEYLVKNYDVNKGGTRHLRAFKMSLCWIAADILGKKIDRKGSLLEARKILNFECPEDLANSVYQKLASLKETFQQLHGKTSDPISSRNVASPLADIAVRSSNLQVPCVKAEVVEILDLEDNQESRDKIVVAKKQKKLRKVQKLCEEHKLELRQKHEEKVQEFIKKWNEKREKLVKEITTELAVFSDTDNHNPSGTKSNKLIEETNRFSRAIQDLECPKEWERREMEKKHAAEMEEVKRKCENLLAKAEAKYGSGGSTMINDSNASDATTGASPITIASDVVILDVSANVETEEVGCGSPSIPVSSEQPDAANVSSQNSKDFAAAKVNSDGQIVVEIRSTPNNTETDFVSPGSHGGPLPVNVIVNEILSTNGDTKGDLVSLGCHSGSLPEDAPSTVGMDPTDCLKPVDLLQSANATDNGTTEEHLVHNQPVALNERHTMLHVSDDCRSSTDLREASVSDSQVDIGQSNTRVNIVDSADCDSRPDSHTAEELDKMRAGEQSVGAHAQNLVCHTQLEENAGELNKQPVLENGEDGMLLSSDNATGTVDSRDSRHDSDTAGEPDKILAGELSAGAQAQNLVSPIQVDVSVGELHKQSVLENGEDSVGELHEPGEQFDSFQNHALSDVAGNAAELQIAAILSSRSNLVSVEADSHVHPDLPPVSGIDHELNGELFVGFQNPESISGVAANAVFSLPPQPQFAWHTNQWLLADPLQREFIKRCNEKEQVNKLHEDTNSQLNAAREKAMQEMFAQMRDKYTKKLRDAESSCTVKKTEIEAKHKMLVMNRLLANAFRSKCRYFISSGSSDVVQPGAPSGLLHQQQFLSSSESSLRHSPVASSSPLGQPATVNRVYSAQRQPVVSLASSQPASIQQTNTPSAQFTPRSLTPSLTHSRLPQISTVTPTIGIPRVGGSFVRAPAPHLQPFRPPSSSQPARLGINQNHHLNDYTTSVGENGVQPGPPRNPTFSAVDLVKNVPNQTAPVSNNNAGNASGSDAQALCGVASNMVCLSDDDDNRMI